MAHTYSDLVVHALFSTKDRRPAIDRELAPQLFAYMAQVIKNVRAEPILINGVSDHAHLLFRLPPVLALADVMEKVKANSSRWVRQAKHKRFAWQTGYTAFSVSRSNVVKVREYIAEQERHHRRMSFREEVLAFLKKHGVPYDERYVFD
jgi:REP element-mobilizing transposase RayT